MSLQNKFQKLYSGTQLCHSLTEALDETAASGGVSRLSEICTHERNVSYFNVMQKTFALLSNPRYHLSGII